MKEINRSQLTLDPFALIGGDWMLLTAGTEETGYNTMTCSWGHFGPIWAKDTAIAYVRPQRYTKEFVDREKLYTLCFFDGKKKELGYLGSRSGRDEDKVAAVGFTPVFGEGYTYFAEAKLVLVGDGELRDAVVQKANQLPENSVLLLGTRNDIPELLQAADVFVFPSLFEGLPVTMIEAQAAGLPCVMSDTVTNECIVTDLVTTLPINDPVVWAEEIIKKLGIPRTDRLEEIGAAGYDIATAAEKLTRFYLNGENL